MAALVLNFLVIDEIKWQVRAPTRFARSTDKMTYLEQVRREVQNYLNENIKIDYLRPDRALSLDLTVKEAELLVSATPKVQQLGASGELENMHTRCRETTEKVESSYLTLRD